MKNDIHMLDDASPENEKPKHIMFVDDEKDGSTYKTHQLTCPSY